MIIAVVLNGTMGLGMLIASFYSMGDSASMLHSESVPFVVM
jgi:hypothetical protein